MTEPQPIYLFVKPPVHTAREIEDRRRILGIESSYGRDRFHMTVLPLGDGRETPGWLCVLGEAIASLHAEPVPVTLDKLSSNALVGGAAMRDLRAFQKQLVRRLIAYGLPIPDFDFRPHLSITYGAPVARRIAIPPICWLVEELLLIRSIHGQGRHQLLERWPLARRQGCFPF